MIASLLLPLIDKTPAPEDVRPGWVALLLVLALFVAVVLLCLSLRKQLRRIDFEDPDAPPAPPEDVEGSGEPAPAGPVEPGDRPTA